MQEPRTDIHLEDESNDTLSSENGNEDDDDNANWSQSDNWPQWDLGIETSCMPARQSPPNQFDMPSVEVETLGSPLPTDGMLPFSSFDQSFPEQSLFQTGGLQALEASDISHTGVQVENATIICGNSMTE